MFAEDDIKFSPFYYFFIKECLRSFKCRWDSNIVGCSFYTPRVNELSKESVNEWNPIKFSIGRFVKDDKTPFVLFQLPSSWGSIYSGVMWSKLQTYYQLRQIIKSNNYFLPNSRSNDWERSWKR